MTADESDFRYQFVFDAGKCDVCGYNKLDTLACHEAGRSRGVNRANAICEPSCLLVVCAFCHQKCHEGAITEAEQLAYIKLRRPKSYDLERYYAICGRRLPSEADIAEALESIHQKKL